MMSSTCSPPSRLKFLLYLVFLGAGIGILVSLSYMLAALVIMGLCLLGALAVRWKLKYVVTLLAVAVVVGPLGNVQIDSSRSLQIFALDLVMPILVVASVTHLMHHKARSRVFLLLGLLVIATTPSLLSSYFFMRTIGVLRYTWFAFLIYALLVQWRANEEDLRFSIRILVTAGALFSLVYAVRVLIPRSFVIQQDIRVGEILLDASVNYISILLVPFTILSLAATGVSTKVGWQIVGFLLTVSLAFLSIVAVSRTAIIGLSVGLAFYLWQRPMSGRGRRSWRVLVMLVGLVLAVGILFLITTPYFQLRYQNTLRLLTFRSWDALVEAKPVTDIESGDWIRIQLWDRYIKEVLHRLWWGSGLGGLPDPYQNSIPMPAHNWVLEFLAGVGIIGTAVYVYLLVWAYRQACPLVNSRWQSALAMTARATWGAALVAALFQPFLSTGYQFIVLLWLFLALAAVRVSPTQPMS